MTQVVQILRDALGHLKVQDANAAVKAIDARDGMRALNLMMRTWEADGLSMGWQDVSDPAEDLPAPPEAEEAIGYHLAIRLRARYGVALDPDIVGLAMTSLATLSAHIQANTFERVEYPDLPAGVRGAGDGWRDGYYN